MKEQEGGEDGSMARLAPSAANMEGIARVGCDSRSGWHPGRSCSRHGWWAALGCPRPRWGPPLSTRPAEAQAQQVASSTCGLAALCPRAAVAAIVTPDVTVGTRFPMVPS